VELCGNSETKYGESEKCIIAFCPESNARTLQHASNGLCVVDLPGASKHGDKSIPLAHFSFLSDQLGGLRLINGV
jgi:hypothetical protein